MIWRLSLSVSFRIRSAIVAIKRKSCRYTSSAFVDLRASLATGVNMVHDVCMCVRVKVTFIGVVRTVEETSTTLSYSVDDMTGEPMQVRKYIQDNEVWSTLYTTKYVCHA